MTATQPPTATSSLVLETPAADPATAHAHFSSKLAFETDSADVYADLQAGHASFLLIDTRSPAAYAEAHLPGAISLPSGRITAQAVADWPKDRLLVTYCWGPGCNGSTKGAARLSALGFRVKELIGGIEYWRRESYPLETGA
jgi:rhodanese-related sulfurtransferase